MIQHNIFINEMKLLPEKDGHQNVVAVVQWEFMLTDDEFMSKGIGRTPLNLSNLDNFTPVEQLTEAQVASWVYAELQSSGTLVQLINFHSQIVAEKKAMAQLVTWDQPLLDPIPRPLTDTTATNTTILP